jgi:hypothetical protein
MARFSPLGELASEREGHAYGRTALLQIEGKNARIAALLELDIEDAITEDDAELLTDVPVEEGPRIRAAERTALRSVAVSAQACASANRIFASGRLSRRVIRK